MQTVDTATRSISHMHKRAKKPVNPLNESDLGDAYFIALIEEIKAGLKTPDVSHKEVLKAVASGNVSPDVVEELEDAILVSSMEEGLNSESVSLDEVMSFLTQ